MAFVEYKRCQVTSAVQVAEDAARLAPTVSFYQGVLASYYEAQGRQQSAADLYAGLQAAPATDAYAHLVAGDYAWRTGLTETAVSELQAVVAISNATPLFQSLAHAGLAQIAAANGQPAAAIDALSASLTAWPGNADAQARRGDLALTAGDAAAAATAYQQALALLADYRQQLGSDSAALLEVTIPAPGPGDAQPDAAASWFAQAQAGAGAGRTSAAMALARLGYAALAPATSRRLNALHGQPRL
ncbi:tetratricopeptide repeat protein [Candidatus Amarolinea dominans]|uniref:tetratricopeptide repeat protein n=1 Tax=Candidatus Amarolinea dominans TaxID=3140696 RepID=UPI0031CC8617